jgi:hypothetical protein
MRGIGRALELSAAADFRIVDARVNRSHRPRLRFAVSFRVTGETRERPRQDISHGPSARERGSKWRSVKARERAPGTSGKPPRVTMSLARNRRPFVRMAAGQPCFLVLPCVATHSSNKPASIEMNRDAFSEVFMIPAATVIHQYRWSKIPRHRGCQLTQNGELVGTLECPSLGSSIFIATAAGRSGSSGDAAFGGAEPRLSTRGRSRGLPSSKQPGEPEECCAFPMVKP